MTLHDILFLDRFDLWDMAIVAAVSFFLGQAWASYKLFSKWRTR